MKTVLDAHSEARDDLRVSARYVRQVADALHVIGMTTAADTIWDYIDSVEEAMTSISKAIGAEINTDLNRAQKDTADALKALLIPKK